MRGARFVLGVISCAALGCGRLSFDAEGAPGDGSTPDFGGGAPAVRSRLELNRVNPSTPIEGFPLLVVLDETRADRSLIQPDASDIRFRDASGAVIPHEIDEVADPALFAWVRVPLYDSDETYITVEYGGTPAPKATGPMWDATYEGVWHLGNTTSVFDASSHARSGTRMGAVVTTGKVGAGAAFDETLDSYIVVPDGAIASVTALVISAWVRYDKSSTRGSGFSAVVARQYMDEINDELYLGFDSDDGLSVVYETEIGQAFVDGTAVAFGETHHYIAVWEPGLGTLYADGERIAMSEIPGNAIQDTGRPIFFGANRNYAESLEVADEDFLTGMIDEVRIENVVRSPAWYSAQAAGDDDRIITYGPIERL